MLTALIFVGMGLWQSNEAEAQPAGPFGLGVIIGGPTGVTGKYWISGNNAIDMHIGLDGIGRGGGGGFYADYLWHFNLTSTGAFDLPLYIGPGLGIVIDDDDEYCNRFGDCRREDDAAVWLAIRAPLGIAFLFKSFPGELFLELPFSLNLVPAVFFDIDVAIGFRFYF